MRNMSLSTHKRKQNFVNIGRTEAKKTFICHLNAAKVTHKIGFSRNLSNDFCIFFEKISKIYLQIRTLVL